MTHLKSGVYYPEGKARVMAQLMASRANRSLAKRRRNIKIAFYILSSYSLVMSLIVLEGIL